jgi:hypothetical protein
VWKERVLSAPLPFEEGGGAGGSGTKTGNITSGNTSNDKSALTKLAGGALLCLLEPSEVAYSAKTNSTMRHYITTGVTSHFINEIEALHDYVPFEVPRVINTAEDGEIQALGSGTLRFAAAGSSS